jgi:hypothetical protein
VGVGSPVSSTITNATHRKVITITRPSMSPFTRRSREFRGTVWFGLFMIAYSLTREAILKMGRYMATMMNPRTVPRNTIIMGSSIAVRASTARSTSSS